MSILNWLQYVKVKLQHPNLVGYADMGLGIAARERRFRRFWAPHLRCSKEFIAQHVTGSCCVFGAGRLFDFPLEELRERKIGPIRLIDNDPGAIAACRRRCRRSAEISFILQDLTGVFEDFNSQLKVFFTANPQRNDKEFVRFILDWSGKVGNTQIDCDKVDTVVSLNILSQLPVYFIDEAARYTHRSWGFSGTAPAPESIEAAYSQLGAALQRQHLRLLAKTARARVIVITDLEYYYYRTSEANWQIDEGLYIHPIVPVGFEETVRDSWWWHIVPAGYEADYGEIHNVGARLFTRKQKGKDER